MVKKKSRIFILLYLSIIWSYQTSYRLLTKSMTNIHINIEKNKLIFICKKKNYD